MIIILITGLPAIIPTLLVCRLVKHCLHFHIRAPAQRQEISHKSDRVGPTLIHIYCFLSKHFIAQEYVCTQLHVRCKWSNMKGWNCSKTGRLPTPVRSACEKTGWQWIFQHRWNFFLILNQNKTQTDREKHFFDNIHKSPLRCCTWSPARNRHVFRVSIYSGQIKKTQNTHLVPIKSDKSVTFHVHKILESSILQWTSQTLRTKNYTSFGVFFLMSF